MPRGRGALRGNRGRFGNFTDARVIVNHPGLPPPPPPPRWVSRPANYVSPPRWRHRNRRWTNNPNYQQPGASPDGASGEDYSSIRWNVAAKEDQAYGYDDPGTHRDHQDIPDACFICGDVLSNHTHEPSIHVCESGEYVITEDQLLPKDPHTLDVDDMKAKLGQAQSFLEEMSRQLQDFWDRIRPATTGNQGWSEEERREEGEVVEEKVATFADQLVENLGVDLQEEYKHFMDHIKGQIHDKCAAVEEESQRLNKQTCDIESKMEQVEQRMKELDIREQEVEDMRQKVQLQRTRYIKEYDSEKAEIQRQWQKLRDETKRMEDMYRLQEGRVRLDIGGHIFTTSIATLTKDPDSMLAAMFSGRHKVKKEEDGTIFIDRDGTHFRYILNYLRDGGVLEGSLPEDKQALKELLNESVYYQITGLVEAIETKL